jgi:hypothetical protein
MASPLTRRNRAVVDNRPRKDQSLACLAVEPCLSPVDRGEVKLGRYADEELVVLSSRFWALAAGASSPPLVRRYIPINGFGRCEH